MGFGALKPSPSLRRGREARSISRAAGQQPPSSWQPTDSTVESACCALELATLGQWAKLGKSLHCPSRDARVGGRRSRRFEHRNASVASSVDQLAMHTRERARSASRPDACRSSARATAAVARRELWPASAPRPSTPRRPADRRGGAAGWQIPRDLPAPQRRRSTGTATQLRNEAWPGALQ